MRSSIAAARCCYAGRGRRRRAARDAAGAATPGSAASAHGAAADRGPELPGRAGSAERHRRRRAGSRCAAPAGRARRGAAHESGVGDEALHDAGRRWNCWDATTAGRPTPGSAARWWTARCRATWCSRAAAIPKITIEQWQSFMAELRAKGLVTVGGDLVLDRSSSRCRATTPRRSTARRCVRTTSVRTPCWSTSSRCASCSRPAAPATRRSCARSRRCRKSPSARRRRRPPVRATTGARPSAPPSPTAATPPAPASPAAFPWPAASATGTSRCWITRITSAACSRPTSARPAAASPAACGTAAHPPAPRRSPRWPRRRSTTSSATSTSCRTT